MAGNDQYQRGQDDGPQDFKPVPVPDAKVREVAKQTGLPVEQVNPFVMLYAGTPYITKAGLQFKADQRFGIGEYYVMTRFPTDQEYTMALRMMHWPENEPIIIMITEFFLSTRPDRPLYTNMGTASRKNCSVIKGVNNFDKRGLEIATTRSQNRTLRQATSCGFAPLDEVWDGDESQVQAQAPNVPARGGDPFGGFLSRCAELKADLQKRGQIAEYYATLEKFGVKHANQVQPGDTERQFDILIALRSIGATPKKEREAIDTVFGEELPGKAVTDATYTEIPSTAAGDDAGQGSQGQDFAAEMEEYKSTLGGPRFLEVLKASGYTAVSRVPADAKIQEGILVAMLRAVNAQAATA